MRVAFIGLLPYPTRFRASAFMTKPHVFTDDISHPVAKRRTGIAAARRAATKRRRAKL